MYDRHIEGKQYHKETGMKQFFVFWFWGNVKRFNLIEATSLEDAKAVFENTIAAKYADGIRLEAIVERGQ